MSAALAGRRRALLSKLTGAPDPHCIDTIQSLWSGYGSLERWRLSPGQTIILKRIAPPAQASHPRGWNSDLAHRRKLNSYRVEAKWYRRTPLPGTPRQPNCVAVASLESETLLLLEDLDASGFALRVSQPDETQIELCIQWLAQFHAAHLGQSSEGLWPQGSYWHLDTRPEEWARMTDARLQGAAHWLDDQLKTCPYQTLIHGDAKLANFCFADSAVAAVDFQYVGGGVGVVDLAYLLGCAYEGPDLAKMTPYWLDRYFDLLLLALRAHPVDGADLESCWRALYPVAVADFARFLDGWAPDHWKINDYNKSLVAQLLERR
ncbi:phosphotransferase [Ferrimonas balearica]|uniref:phosphotransferase n=1 Tax=Ferrimonas balearica TaxID=44012 RepID=UPI001C998D0D|nr:phosphotransferase [Ferrimonas balearica]MBY5991629.1 ecdysteroid 22-kinase family protein [Ferrimonas balearica]